MSDQTQMNGSSSSTDLKWLNHSYLSKILSHYEGQPVQVKTYAIRPATSKGENYASAMNLANVEYIHKGNENQIYKISMILKSRLENEIFDEIEQEMNAYGRESQVYKTIMKRCEELLATIGDDVKFGPRALYVDERVIVQENLKDRGYSIMNVKDGLDYDHCQWVMKLLAKFHATTMILGLQEPELFKYHMIGNVSEKPTPLHFLYKNALGTCIEYVKTKPKLQCYLNKLEKFDGEIINNMIKVFTRNRESEVIVLNHGDMWVNNLMFKKDSAGNILGLLMVDYQEGYFGSPGIDLNYFIYSSMSKDVYKNHKNDLIEIYHKILVDTLKLLDFKGSYPTIKTIHNEILNKAHHGLTTATCLYPILVSEHQELADPANFLLDTEEAKQNRFTVFNNQKYEEFLELVLPDFEANGIL